ncbi:MAG: hypothetical protein A3K59_11275 [Euryarchaeota archaeon RBG_19FT_COMBO_69_17]|nr:MAG: hypothetical protein A3K59_11275 [Euryarchaeota archaeon RBG_19FT_COMBO_69_17]
MNIDPKRGTKRRLLAMWTRVKGTWSSRTWRKDHPNGGWRLMRNQSPNAVQRSNRRVAGIERDVITAIARVRKRSLGRNPAPIAAAATKPE